MHCARTLACTHAQSKVVPEGDVLHLVDADAREPVIPRKLSLKLDKRRLVLGAHAQRRAAAELVAERILELARNLAVELARAPQRGRRAARREREEEEVCAERGAARGSRRPPRAWPLPLPRHLAGVRLVWWERRRARGGIGRTGAHGETAMHFWGSAQLKLDVQHRCSDALDASLHRKRGTLAVRNRKARHTWAAAPSGRQ
jgi:hypothetical protein